MKILITSASTYTARALFSDVSLLDNVQVIAAVEDGFQNPNWPNATVKWGDAALDCAFDVLLLVPPPDGRQRNGHASKWLTRAKQAQAKYIIHLSPLAPRNVGSYDSEYYLNATKVEDQVQNLRIPYTILQAPVYNHQLFDYIRTCALARVTCDESGTPTLTLPFPLQSHLLPPSVDVRDVSTCVAFLVDAFQRGEMIWTNNTFALRGPEQLSGVELAGAVARGLGLGSNSLQVAVKYVNVSLEEFGQVWKGVVEQELGPRATPETIQGWLFPVYSVADAVSRGAWDSSRNRAQRAMIFDDEEPKEDVLIRSLRQAGRKRPFSLADHVRIHKEEILSILKRWEDGEMDGVEEKSKKRWIVRSLSAPPLEHAKDLLIVEPDTGYVDFLDQPKDKPLDEDNVYEYAVPRAPSIEDHEEGVKKQLSPEEWIRRWRWNDKSKL